MQVLELQCSVPAPGSQEYGRIVLLLHQTLDIVSYSLYLLRLFLLCITILIDQIDQRAANHRAIGIACDLSNMRGRREAEADGDWQTVFRIAINALDKVAQVRR